MKKVYIRNAAVASVIFVIVGTSVLYYYGYISWPGLFNTGYPLYGGTPVLATIPQVQSGAFPTSYDKQGTGGTLVQLSNLRVLGVTNEIDGDIHVAVTDDKSGILVTEITPIAQRFLNGSYPVVNQTISVIGTPYCDVAHASEAWHGYSCWEVHPLVAWKQTGTAPPASIAASRFFFLPEPQNEP